VLRDLDVVLPHAVDRPRRQRPVDADHIDHGSVPAHRPEGGAQAERLGHRTRVFRAAQPRHRPDRGERDEHGTVDPPVGAGRRHHGQRMLGAVVEQHPVRPAPGDQASEQPDAGDPELDHGAVDRRGEPLVQPQQGALAPGPVGHLGGQLAHLVGGQLRLEIVEEALPPHVLSVVSALTCN
jgi:hypothetical protein